ncbi:protein sanA-like protein [Hapalosiphon sp. MRB220]|nr:protein sanA-like protein [Hapalosiphon sp. MRB220]
MLTIEKIKKPCLAIVLLCLVPVIMPILAIITFSIYVYSSKTRVSNADAAIVLGAEVWGKKPSPVFRERINHAIALYKHGKVHNIIFTGGVGKNKEIAEAIVGKRYAISKGVKKADILTETASQNTHQNLLYAKKVALPQHLSKFLIVSDPLHLKRAVLMAQDLGMDAYPSATPTTRYRSFQTKFKFLLRETFGYFVYLFLRP